MMFGTIEAEGRQVPVLRLDDETLLDLRFALGRMGDATAHSRPGMSLHDIIGLGSDVTAKLMRLATGPRGDIEKGLLSLNRVRLLAPIPRPAKNVFCVGRNYAEHITEDNVSRQLDTQVPEAPQFFTKPPTAVVGPDAGVRYDTKVTKRLDYEVELAVVIGANGRDIPADKAYDHVFGYSIVNDVTARDLQRRHDQWFKGKAIDGSCPFGPWIVHKSAIPDPQNLTIKLAVNGQVRQDANTGQMIFKIPEIIASLSSGLTLEAGDIIATGTPSGVGSAMNPRVWLQPGDIMTCTIEGIGILENTIVAP
jgi:2-keto-4-pentenoate hydratase/2-oxohepta-3-ene-1,7-dioic acid hydratase in catechol pathway